jgi:hypothetical protein
LKRRRDNAADAIEGEDGEPPDMISASEEDDDLEDPEPDYEQPKAKALLSFDRIYSKLPNMSRDLISKMEDARRRSQLMARKTACK